MAAIFNWCEDNGVAAGAPSRGTNRSQKENPVVDASWKAVDDAKTASDGTSKVSAFIRAGSNSYSKHLYGQFSGSYNRISNCKWSAHTAPTQPLPMGLTLRGTVTSNYQTPSRIADPRLTTDFTDAVPIDNGLTVLFHPEGPEGTSPQEHLNPGGGFTQYLVTQLQTDASAAPGDIPSVVMMLQFDEN